MQLDERAPMQLTVSTVKPTCIAMHGEGTWLLAAAWVRRAIGAVKGVAAGARVVDMLVLVRETAGATGVQENNHGSLGMSRRHAGASQGPLGAELQLLT